MPDTTPEHGAAAAESKTPRGRPVPSASNAWVQIEALDMNIWQIGQITLKPNVRLDDLENISRVELQKAIKTCFTTPIEIFSNEPPVTDWFPPIKNWLKHTLSLDLVPAALDARLLREDAERFGNTDEDIRGLIDKLVEVFQHNLAVCTTHKRNIQRNATFYFSFGAAVLCAILAAIMVKFSLVWLVISCLLAPIGLVLLQRPILRFFCKANRDLHTEQYRLALQNSAHQVSRCIGGRMMSLNKCFEEYVRKIDGLFTAGEHIENDEAERDDGSYKKGQAFLWLQLLMWLPARVEGLERYLRIKMQEADFLYALADYKGFTRTVRVFRSTLAIPVMMGIAGLICLAVGLIYWVRLEAPFIILSATILVMAAIAGSFAFRVAKQSYGNSNWNPPRRILQEFLDVDSWEVSRRFNIYIRLPARLQKAVSAIAHMEDLLGPRH